MALEKARCRYASLSQELYYESSLRYGDHCTKVVFGTKTLVLIWKVVKGAQASKYIECQRIFLWEELAKEGYMTQVRRVGRGNRWTKRSKFGPRVQPKCVTIHLIRRSLSDQLYQDPSHFLLELIQNADDNTFFGVTPSLSLNLYSVEDSLYLRSDCNEVGLTQNNLRAMTLVGQSTKASAIGGKKGYIGEKGVGFKSIFKVADVVRVASGYYEFMFDRNGTLGMILPILAPFPTLERRPGYTQFLLQIRTRDDYDRIKRDLHHVEPQLLLFLRNLQEMTITSSQSSMLYRVVTHETTAGSFGETKTITLSKAEDDMGTEMKYIIVRHDHGGMPHDGRREGVTTSEVVLAFPVRGSNTPITSNQKVFAFLPIDDYGFKFLIHADFLLVASREGLEYGRPWNVSLRDAVQAAFSAAIARFVTAPADAGDDSMCYMWPKYINHHTSAHSFWNALHAGIIHDLSSAYILQSCDAMAGFFRATDLRYVPELFRFEGQALFDCPSTRRRHLSFGYDQVQHELRHIGIADLTPSDMVTELLTWLTENGAAALSAKPDRWHEKMAFAFQQSHEIKGRLKDLPIIPLVDGSWVSANTKRLYLFSETDDVQVPRGISISLVDKATSLNPTRRALFEFLDIPTYDKKEVCDLIGELHRHMSNVANRDVVDMVADVAYLFRHRSLYWRNSTPVLHLLTNQKGTFANSNSRVYIITDSTGGRVMSKYKDEPGSPFPMLDERYVETICGTDEENTHSFLQWLVAEQSVETTPALVCERNLTPEWLFLRNRDARDILMIIRDLDAKRKLSSQLAAEIPRLKVPCRNGFDRALADVAIPTHKLVQTCPHIVFADLPDPESWGFLAKFKITTRPTTETILEELAALSSMASVDANIVKECYRWLSSNISMVEKARIRSAFNTKPLVFISGPQPEWISHTSCVWSAPAVLKLVTKLSRRYSECKKLFCEFLDVAPAGVRHVVDELVSLQTNSPRDALQRFKGLMPALLDCIGDSSATTLELSRLLTANLFPVVKASGPQAGNVMLCSGSPTDEWYIPDRLTLEATLRGRVDMLALPVQEVKALSAVFSLPIFRDRYLSAVVQETVEPRGSITRDMDREKDLRARLRYIAWFVERLRVWNVPSIVVTRRLRNIVVEDENLVTVQEGAPHSKKYKITFALSHFLCQQYSVQAQDSTIVNSLLEAPIADLDEIMRTNERFLLGTSGAPQHDAGESGDPIDLVGSPTPLVLSIEDQHSIRELVPSFQRSQSATTSARQFRVSKSPVAHGASYTRVRSERHGQSQGSEPLGQPDVIVIDDPLVTDNSKGFSQDNDVYEVPPPIDDTIVEVPTPPSRHWTFENWTSKFRSDAGYPPFDMPEGDFSDFTYIDRDGGMKAYLQSAGLSVNAAWSNSTTYHLEVKTTVGRCGEPFYMSHNQVALMQRYNNDALHAYILVRVFSIEDEPNFKLYPSPWSLATQGVLDFAAQGGYQVVDCSLSRA
ncbi:hypothetical protein B0I35DRAFT_500441 [Stachybotrys elegans]|uniref:Protein NO VEIN C-terminal domain-containing protein n=1 Tax=Stachybotrys elegans TaxID=80388 RepID=A0A8K0SG67_9HYPO|nr:hypothetical protein B0I35DRAFT_500441 [Stachybotrys elegans]